MADRPLTRADLVAALAGFKTELIKEIEIRIEAVGKDLETRIEAVRKDLETRIEAVRKDLETRIESVKDELIEVARGNQTELLNAFMPYQEGTNLRIHRLESSDSDIVGRMAILERRLQQIEKKLLLEPPAA